MESMLLIGSLLRNLYGVILFVVSVFLVLLILIQRGRGGGLAGAFGGMGGQSAFGTKAGDTFTKITIVVATFWIVLCILGVKFGGVEESIMARPGDTRIMGADGDFAGDDEFAGDLDFDPNAATNTDGPGATGEAATTSDANETNATE